MPIGRRAHRDAIAKREKMLDESSKKIGDSVSSEGAAREVRSLDEAKHTLKKEALLLAAESGLNYRTTMRWLSGEARDGRKGVYGTTHKLLSEVAARLSIERRGKIPVRGGPEATTDPVDWTVRRLAEATDFQPRTVRRWLLGQGPVQAATARQLANVAKKLGVDLPDRPKVLSALGPRVEDELSPVPSS
jgi:hypothetical protein